MEMIMIENLLDRYRECGIDLQMINKLVTTFRKANRKIEDHNNVLILQVGHEELEMLKRCSYTGHIDDLRFPIASLLKKNNIEIELIDRKNYLWIREEFN